MIQELINFLVTGNNFYKAKRCKFLAFLARLFRVEIVKILILMALPFIIILKNNFIFEKIYKLQIPLNFAFVKKKKYIIYAYSLDLPSISSHEKTY